MKPMPTIVFVFAVFSLLVVGSSSADEAECKKRHAHNNFYDGTFKITPSETTGPFGWKLTVKFSMKVKNLEVWNFLPPQPTGDGKTFELQSKDGNYELTGGRTYEYQFRATLANGKKGRQLTCDEVTFEPQDEASGGSGSFKA